MNKKPPPKQSLPPPPNVRSSSANAASMSKKSHQQQQRQQSSEHQQGSIRRSSVPTAFPSLVAESPNDISKQRPLVVASPANFHPAAIPTYSSRHKQQQHARMTAAAGSGNNKSHRDSGGTGVIASSSGGNYGNDAAAPPAIAMPAATAFTPTASLYPPYNNHQNQAASTSHVSQSFSSSLYSAPYLPNPSSETLKSRHVASAAPYSTGDGTNSQQQQLQQHGGGHSSSSNSYVLNMNRPSLRNPSTVTIITNNNNTTNNNNVPIAIILLPPLFILLICEMSSPLPLLLLFVIGLVVYALDLANVGGSGNSSSSGGSDPSGRRNFTQRGFYTLCAVWIGWIVLSIVVGYVTIFLGDTFSTTTSAATSLSSTAAANSFHGEGGRQEGQGGGSGSAMSTTNIISLGILLTKLGTSIILLFCLAAWTTLQFQWLPLQIPTLARFFERLIHFILPPISAALVSYELTASSTTLLLSSSSYITTSSLWGGTIGVDAAAIVFPILFACLLSLGIFLVGAAPSSMAEDDNDAMIDDKGKTKKKEMSLLTTPHKDDDDDDDDDDDKHSKRNKAAATTLSCAISPREGRALSYLLVYTPGIIHLVMFRQRIVYSYASWDDLYDFIFTATLPYVLHYLLAANGILDERWRSSLNWLLKAGTSPIASSGRTLRGASVPMVISFLSCISLQQRYLIPACARISYIINGHDGIMPASLATLLLSLGSTFGYATIWFIGRKNSNGEYLMGEYHEDIFQLLLGLSALFFGLSCSLPWAALPIPILLAESLALWVITKQLRFACLTLFVFFTCCTVMIAYRLTFLTETVEIIPGKQMFLKTFAKVSMFAAMWLIVIIGLVHRAPGGFGREFMKKWDVTGVCFGVYGLVLSAMEFSLSVQPMPVYSRDNFEVGRVAVYSASAVYSTGLLTLIITWHLKAQKVIKGSSAMVSSSIAFGKMIAVLIEPNHVGVDNTLSSIYLRWAVASLLLMTICCPYALRPVHLKMSTQLPKNAAIVVVAYCGVMLPLIILASVRLVLEPLVGLLTGHNNAAYYATSPKFSEIIGYSAALWGVSVLSMVNHFLPSGGGEVWKRTSALVFITGLFVSFSAPAFPGTTPSSSNLFHSVSILDEVESDVATGGWGLVSAFLAVVLAMTGPLELREIRNTSGGKDSHQFLRLMIFGLMFGCGLSWFIVMQSMSKDIFIPIFVTTFSCMVMSTLGTVAAVMGYFLETQEFGEVEQIANVWTVVMFPVFFVISSVSLTAHAHPFGIGGWASTYLSVCGLFAGSFCVLVRLRKNKNSTTRGYGNMSCIIAWLCTIIVVYGRYGIAGVGVVGVTTVVGIPVSVLGTFCCSPILLLLEGEGSKSNKHSHQISSAKSKNVWHGLVLTKLTRRNWIVPLLAGTVGVFVTASLYAIFLRGCGLSKFSFIFGTGDVIKSQEDVFSHIFGSKRTTGVGALDDVATMAEKSVVHTKTMIAAARLSGSGFWTAKSIVGPIMHLMGLIASLPSLQQLIKHSWYGKAPLFGKVAMVLPLNILSIIIGKGIPSLVAVATIGLIGGILQLTLTTLNN